ncbi:hypothetical protein REPUB_Repub06bG0122900 [Reevesia pubescens]
MAPTTTRRQRNCYRPREVEFQVERDSSLESSMELPCSHIGSSINSVEVLQTGCSTPKSRKFRISEISSCPAAPMKPRVAPKLLSRRSSAVTFFAPPDIELFFFLAFQNVSA